MRFISTILARLAGARSEKTVFGQKPIFCSRDAALKIVRITAEGTVLLTLRLSRRQNVEAPFTGRTKVKILFLVFRVLAGSLPPISPDSDPVMPARGATTVCTEGCRSMKGFHFRVSVRVGVRLAV